MKILKIVMMMMMLTGGAFNFLSAQGQLVWGPVTPPAQDSHGLYGMCYNSSNDRIYYLNLYNNLIYIASSDQSLTYYGSLPTPYNLNGFADITYCSQDNTFWLVNRGTFKAYHIDTLGNVLGSFDCPATTYPSGITWMENTGTLFFVDRMNASPHYIYETDTLGNLLNTMTHPGQGYLGPRCLASVQAGYSSQLLNVFTHFNSASTLDSSTVMMLNPQTGAWVNGFRFTCSTQDNIRGIEFDPRDNSLWITNFSNG